MVSITSSIVLQKVQTKIEIFFMGDNMATRFFCLLSYAICDMVLQLHFKKGVLA